MKNKFLVEIEGDGFTLTMKGSGDEAAAKKCLSEVYKGCVVKVLSFGGPVDIDSGS